MQLAVSEVRSELSLHVYEIQGPWERPVILYVLRDSIKLLRMCVPFFGDQIRIHFH